MEFFEAKTILTKTKNGKAWYGIDYTMNLYRGCLHGCIYCDSRSNCYHIEAFDVVRGKKNALVLLERELIRKKQTGVVGIGAMSDTYHPQERQYQITRGALQLLAKYGYGVSIDTKSDLILRDLDVLQEINQKHSVIVKFTITTPHDRLSRMIEPRVCVTSKRLQAIKQLSEAGIFVGIMMNPVLPFLTDKEEDIKELVFLAYQSGAKFIHTYMGMTLRDRQRDYYYQRLDQHFKGVKERYILTYGDKYRCSVLQAKRLYQVFVAECKRYGILYRMPDIIKAYQKVPKKVEQLSFFD